MTQNVVVFLGPCRKVNRRSGDLHPPFSEASPSGKFLRNIVNAAVPGSVRVEYDNILETGVFTTDGQECNPMPEQLLAPLLTHRIWREADVVIAFSSGVREAFEAVKHQLGATGIEASPLIHFLHHPSYMMRRPQSERTAYGSAIRKILLNASLCRS
jgi:hypothetical protein